jgi:hypothetical protein
MSSPDLIHMLGNISQSFIPVQSLMSGLGYILGLSMLISGFFRLTKIHKYSQERMAVPVSFILGGAMLIYLPTSVEVLSTTFFGTSNALEYTEYNPYDINSIMQVMIQTAGMIWFVRGSVLLIQSSEPREQHGMKGLVFVFAGIIALNFEMTLVAVESMVTYIINLTK